MTPAEMKRRTKLFAVRTIELCRSLRISAEGRTITSQLIRSSASVGANYRAACRARSRREFVAKLGLVLEEADESVYWIELIVALGLLQEQRVSEVLREAGEIVAIIAAAKLTAEKGRAKPSR